MKVTQAQPVFTEGSAPGASLTPGLDLASAESTRPLPRGAQRPGPATLLLALALAGAPWGARGQAAVPSPLPPLTAVAVTGSMHFSSGQLVAATGLRLQQAVSLDLLNHASRRLADSGDFSRVTYHYEYSAQGTRVQYEVTDQKPLLPVAFSNFVWLSQDQLIALLHARVPLFAGAVPESGGVDQQIVAALEDWLHRHGLPGATVEGMPRQKEIGGAFSDYLFTVDGVKIPVQQITFTGAPAPLEPVLEAQAKSLLGADFSRERMQAAVHSRFLPQLQNRGYLQASFSAPTVTLADAARNAVTVSYAVTPGLLFHWGQISFVGNTVFDAQTLAGWAGLQSADIADLSKLDAAVTAIQEQYRAAGYMEASVTHSFDSAQPGQAAPQLLIAEGPLYYMGELNFVGFGPKTVAQMRGMWKLASGQPYSVRYLKGYIQTLSQKFNFHGFTLSTLLKQSPQAQTVDLTITLAIATPNGGPR